MLGASSSIPKEKKKVEEVCTFGCAGHSSSLANIEGGGRVKDAVATCNNSILGNVTCNYLMLQRLLKYYALREELDMSMVSSG